jgi:hypothetical protein
VSTYCIDLEDMASLRDQARLESFSRLKWTKVPFRRRPISASLRARIISPTVKKALEIWVFSAFELRS